MSFDLELAARIGSAADERSLACLMRIVADSLGASSFNVLRFTTTEHGKAVDEMTSYSQHLLDTFDDFDWPDWRDPVMQHVRCSSVPILWDRSTYEKQGLAATRAYEILADHGVGFGASIAVHVGPSRHLFMGLAWPHSARADAERQLVQLQLCALHAEPAFHRVWSARDPSLVAPDRRLSPRELETLYMASCGLKIPAMAARHGRSPRTFEKFARDAVSKLNAANLTEAVSIAERIGLLDSIRATTLQGRRRPVHTLRR